MHCVNHEWDLFTVIITKSQENIVVLVDVIEESRKFISHNDVIEKVIEISALYGIAMKSIHREFRERWVMYLSAAFKAMVHNIDIIIHVLMINILKNKHKVCTVYFYPLLSILQ